MRNKIYTLIYDALWVRSTFACFTFTKTMTQTQALHCNRWCFFDSLTFHLSLQFSTFSYATENNNRSLATFPASTFCSFTPLQPPLHRATIFNILCFIFRRITAAAAVSNELFAALPPLRGHSCSAWCCLIYYSSFHLFASFAARPMSSVSFGLVVLMRHLGWKDARGDPDHAKALPHDTRCLLFYFLPRLHYADMRGKCNSQIHTPTSITIPAPVTRFHMPLFVRKMSKEYCTPYERTPLVMMESLSQHRTFSLASAGYVAA